MENIIETKICKQCSIKFDITDKDLEFYEKISPVFNGIKYSIPTPTLCPYCRQKRRLSWRHERKLYKRNCDLTGKSIISMHSPDKPYRIYDQDIWWSDRWNALDYGMDFDFDRNFFEQFEELYKQVPKCSIDVFNMENSTYNNQSSNLKDCYLLMNSEKSENCYYGSSIYFSKDCIDCLRISNCQQCYNCIDCENSYNLHFSIGSKNCTNSYYLNNCQNCENCFLCQNLDNKKFFILNKEYPQDNYFKKIDEILKLDEKEKIALLENLHLPKKTLEIINSENYSGNYIKNSKNVLNCFDVYNCEDLKNCTDINSGKKLFDVDFFGINLENVLNSVNIGINSSNIAFSVDCRDNISNVYYSSSCFANCKNLFGCVGLKNKEYCILNKQYTREEYEILVPKIIERMQKVSPIRGGAEGGGVEWGEFFPASISPFGYNETVAMEYYPLDPPVINNIPLNKGDNWNEVKVGGLFNWSLYESPKPDVSKIIPASSLPENISDIPDDILNWAIECEVTGRPYRIIKQELEFYRKHNLPIPRRHPDERHLDRLRQRNPRKLYK